MLTLVANSQNPQFCVEKCYVKSRCLRHSRQFATSINVGIGPTKALHHAASQKGTILDFFSLRNAPYEIGTVLLSIDSPLLPLKNTVDSVIENLL